MKSLLLTAAFFSAAVIPSMHASSAFDITVKDIKGADTSLAAYRGKVLLIVNVASKCGYTKQYAGLEALHAYAATLNMGTLVGAPKIRAAELLRGHECSKRGPYGGAVGYLTHAGDMDTAIVIRSALVRNGVAHIRAGAGVVLDSDPARETEETRRKAMAVVQAVGGAPQ